MRPIYLRKCHQLHHRLRPFYHRNNLPGVLAGSTFAVVEDRIGDILLVGSRLAGMDLVDNLGAGHSSPVLAEDMFPSGSSDPALARRSSEDNMGLHRNVLVEDIEAAGHWGLCTGRPLRTCCIRCEYKGLAVLKVKGVARWL